MTLSSACILRAVSSTADIVSSNRYTNSCYFITPIVNRIRDDLRVKTPSTSAVIGLHVAGSAVPNDVCVSRAIPGFLPVDRAAIAHNEERYYIKLEARFPQRNPRINRCRAASPRRLRRLLSIRVSTNVIVLGHQSKQ